MSIQLRRLITAAFAVMSLISFTAAPLAQASHHHRRHHRHHSRIPQHNGGDKDADNNGGPSDGDGNV
jgi:hypothetical protein